MLKKTFSSSFLFSFGVCRITSPLKQRVQASTLLLTLYFSSMEQNKGTFSYLLKLRCDVVSRLLTKIAKKWQFWLYYSFSSFHCDYYRTTKLPLYYFLNCSETSCSLMYQIQIRFTACTWIFHEKKSILLFFSKIYIFGLFLLPFLMFFFNLLKWFFFFKKASWEKRATYAARTRVVHFLIIGNWRSRGKQTKKFHRNFLFQSFQRFHIYWNWYLPK